MPKSKNGVSNKWTQPIMSEKMSDNVLSMDEFRQILRNPPSHEDVTVETQPSAYVPVDQLAAKSVRAVLRRLYGRQVPSRIVVVERTTQECAEVKFACNSEAWAFGISRNSDDTEALLVPFEYADEDTNRHLRRPVDNFYLTTLVARRMIERVEEPKQDRSNISLPTIGLEEVKLDIGSQKHNSVVTWRTAAGLGLLAVGKESQRLRHEIREYVEEILEERMHYNLDIQLFEKLIGNALPCSEPTIPDYMLGIGNPFNPGELMELNVVPQKVPFNQ